MAKKSSAASAVLDPPKPKGIRVRAKILRGEGKYVGYYGVRRIREGQIFTIKNEKELGSWMEKVDAHGKPLNEDGTVRDEAELDEVPTENDTPDGEDVL